MRESKRAVASTTFVIGLLPVWQLGDRNGRPAAAAADLSQLTPSNGSDRRPGTVRFTWTAATDGTYEVCWDTNTTGTCTPWRSTGTTGSIDVLPAQLPAGTYRWQVRARNLGGLTEADGGTWWTFTALPPRINTADFTGDGKADILWHRVTTGANRLWVMNGTTYSGTTDLQTMTDANWRVVGTADFNGDNQPDILAGRRPDASTRNDRSLRRTP